MVRNFSATVGAISLAQPITAYDLEFALDNTRGLPHSPFALAINQDSTLCEIVEVSAVSGNYVTVTRGVDGTVGISHAVNSPVRHVFTGVDAQGFADNAALTSRLEQDVNEFKQDVNEFKQDVTSNNNLNSIFQTETTNSITNLNTRVNEIIKIQIVDGVFWVDDGVEVTP